METTDVIRSVLRVAIVALCLAPAVLALLQGGEVPRESFALARIIHERRSETAPERAGYRASAQATGGVECPLADRNRPDNAAIRDDGTVAVGVHELSGLEAVPEAKGDTFPEYDIKAAFLYNFIRYTTWPKGALGGQNGPIEILLVGKDPFGAALREAFEGKKLHGRKVTIKHAKHPPKELTAALVFVSGLKQKDEDALIKACTGKPILLIGDRKGSGERGACANFFVERNKVRFQVNTEVTKKSKLTISSQLLKLAKIVKTTRRKR